MYRCCFLFTNLQTMAQINDKRIPRRLFLGNGNDGRVAAKLENVTGGELYPITSADLDWHNRQSRSSVEMNDPKSRPAIKGRMANIADYDVIFIGYPIWWVSRRALSIHSSKVTTRKSILLFPFTSGDSTLAGSAAILKGPIRP